MILTTSLRTFGAGEARPEHNGTEVNLCGWLHARRDHGGVLFFDLRDRSGLVQIVAHPDNKEVFETASSLRSEFVVRVTGKVSPRPVGTENPKLPTGAIEVHASNIEVLSPSDPLPFEISEHVNVNEEIRLKYRFLDLRRKHMADNLMLRHRAAQAARKYLDGQGFIEVETPILTKSTPEGARDFLVPSRLSPGEFYALPQSPQIFKQILMVSGIDRYFQLARAFRDEDLRSDRQPEHTQIDCEMSFVKLEDVHRVCEGMMKAIFKETLGLDLETPFPSYEYADMMLRYGSDKPDLRFGLEIVELSEALKGTGFKVFGATIADGGAVRAITAQQATFSRADIDKLTDFVKTLGAKGLAWIKWTDKEGKVVADSPIAKFMSEGDLASILAKTGAKAGDVTFFGAGKADEVALHLGGLRKELIVKLALKPSKPWAFLWVKHFPLLEWDADEKVWTFAHNPFTAPLTEEIPMLDTDPGKMRSNQYDLVLNGSELASGSVRNHRVDIQEKIFGLMGYDAQERQKRFGLLLNALRFGAPPHGGFGLGFDRLCAILRGEDSIREVIAFPKTQKGTDPLSECPSPVSAKQLKELHISLNVPAPKPATPAPAPQAP